MEYYCQHCGGHNGSLVRLEDEVVFDCHSCLKRTRYLIDTEIVVDHRTQPYTKRKGNDLTPMEQWAREQSKRRG
jgi:hypothetical protein